MLMSVLQRATSANGARRAQILYMVFRTLLENGVLDARAQ